MMRSAKLGSFKVRRNPLKDTNDDNGEHSARFRDSAVLGKIKNSNRPMTV